MDEATGLVDNEEMEEHSRSTGFSAQRSCIVTIDIHPPVVNLIRAVSICCYSIVKQKGAVELKEK